MLLRRKLGRNLFRGLGDEQTDLKTQVDIASDTLSKEKQRTAQMNANLTASLTTGIMPISTSTGETGGIGPSNDKSILSTIISKDATGKTKVFGLDWYIPVAGAGALLFLLKR